MKEHIYAIQKYMMEKYGVNARVEIKVHDTANKEVAEEVVSGVSNELQVDYYNSNYDGAYWFGAKTDDFKNKVKILAFYKGE